VSSSASPFDPRAFIGGVEWRYAATMPDTPHEYVLESTAGGPEFVAFHELINREGRVKTFKGHPYRYVTVDDHVYWTTSSPYGAGRIINRRRAVST
jgi:hypothetical protein